MNTIKKQIQRQRRKKRVRAKISGTHECPRMTVYRSLTKISIQLIDDQNGKTLTAVSSKKQTMQDAKESGKIIAEQAKEIKISKCVFDRNGYAFHGKIKAVADAARDAGLQF